MKRFVSKPTPLYINVRKAILEAIAENDIGQDDKLPSEETLAQIFSASRSTIRNALQLLENEGIISKHHGSETIINRMCLDLKIRIDESKGYKDMIQQCGHNVSILSHSFRCVTISDAIAKRLMIDCDSQCYEMRQILAGDGVPIIYANEYIPISNFHKIPDKDDFPIDIFELAEKYLIRPISYSIVELGSLAATQEILNVMGGNSNESFIRFDEVHCCPENKPIALSEAIIRDSKMQLQFIRRKL